MSRLFLRISLGILLVLVASSVVIRWGAIHATKEHFEQHFARLPNAIDRLRQELDAVPEGELRRTVRRLGSKGPYRLRLLSPGSQAIPKDAREVLSKGQLQMEHRHLRWRLFVPIRGGRSVLVLAPRRPPFRHGNYPVVAVVGSILGVICLTGFILAFPLVRRLRRLERTAQRLAAGELQARADASSKDAIGSLARRFNAMADRVQQLLESQQHLLQAVSHELRTPSARIRFGLEMLAMAESEEERQQRIQAIDEDLSELDQLVQELLLYIRGGESALDLELEEVEAAEEVRSLVPRLAELRSEISVTVDSEDRGPYAARVDRRFFCRAIQNLLSNAIRHAQQEVAVTLQFRKEDGALQVAVADDGPGIPLSEQERIFEPFARLDQSRDRRSGGAGLGLAIAKRIVQAHGGVISLDPTPDKGARFVTTWPVPPPQQ